MRMGTDNQVMMEYSKEKMPSMAHFGAFLFVSNTQAQSIRPVGNNIMGNFHSESAGAALINDQNQVIDAVRFGRTTYSSYYTFPINDNQWKGDNASWASDKSTQLSYVRLAPYKDTNTAQDWGISHYPTPLGDNDFTTEEDLDQMASQIASKMALMPKASLQSVNGTMITYP